MFKYLIKTVLLLLCMPLGAMEDRIYNHLPQAVTDLPAEIYSYLHKLPRLKNNGAESPTEKARVITKFLCYFGNQQHLLKGTEILEEKIVTFIEQDEPIRFILVGFPTKSTNTDTKILKPTFDMAELVGMFTLNHMCKEIRFC